MNKITKAILFPIKLILYWLSMIVVLFVSLIVASIDLLADLFSELSKLLGGKRE